MPANRFADVFVQGGAANVPAAGTEGVLMTTPPLNLPFDNQPVCIIGYYGCVPGAGVTGLAFAVRRGTTITAILVAGTSTLAYAVTAAANQSFTVMVIDTPGIVAGVQYSLTCIATGGAAASVAQTLCSMLAFCL